MAGGCGRAQKPLPVELVVVARPMNAAVESLAQEYAGMVRRYAPFAETRLAPNPKNSAKAEVQVEAEGQKVLGRLRGDDFVVALDERGKDLSSEGLAELLAEPPGGAGRVVFLIGGPYGHSPEVRERARARGAVVRLSRMVLNHQVARLVALEQIYRGWTIIRGEKYHH